MIRFLFFAMIGLLVGLTGCDTDIDPTPSLSPTPTQASGDDDGALETPVGDDDDNTRPDRTPRPGDDDDDDDSSHTGWTPHPGDDDDDTRPVRTPRPGDDDLSPEATSTPAGDDDMSPAGTPTPSGDDDVTPELTPFPMPTPFPPDPLYIVGTKPADGCRGVSITVDGQVLFNQPYVGGQIDGDTSLVHVNLVQGEEVEPQLLFFGGNVATFSPYLEQDTDYCLTVEVEYQEDILADWPLYYEACFTTHVPCGVPIDVGYNTTIVTLGNNALAVTAMNKLLSFYGSAYPVVMLLENVSTDATFPLEGFNALLGAYEVKGNGTIILDGQGYPTTFQGCTVGADGALSCFAESAVIPLNRSETSVNLYVTNVFLTGKLVTSGNITTMSTFRLDGVVTEADMTRTEDEIGIGGVSMLVSLDYDVDGDGVLDAATFSLETMPQPLVLEDASCEGRPPGY